MATKITIGPYSAYAIAVKYGYTGTEEDWINSVETARKVAESAAEHADNCAKSADDILTAIGVRYADWLLDAHPVGSLYLSADPTSPAELFGGTWEQIAQDRALMGASSTHPAGTTAEAGLPNITGSTRLSSTASLLRGSIANSSSYITGCFFKGTGRSPATALDNAVSGYDLSFSAANSNSIYGKSATVQPPAYFVNIWRRIE